MIYSYVKNTRNVKLMFAMIFSNFRKLRHARESPSKYYYYYTSRLERLQPYRNEISPMARFMGKKSLEKSNRNKANRFKKSIEFFNRSNISIEFFHRSNFSIDRIFQSIKHSNRSKFSID